VPKQRVGDCLTSDCELDELAEEKEKNERLEDKAKSDILILGSSGRLHSSIKSTPSLAILASGYAHQGKAISKRPVGARSGFLAYPKKKGSRGFGHA